MLICIELFADHLMHSDMDHIVLPANNTMPAFTRKHSPGGATTHIRIANA